MNTSKKLSGFALASAAALMLTACSGESGGEKPAATAEGDAAQEATIHCMGINACKGQSGCATASSSCKGQNGCKGQGWVEKTAEECKTEGGAVG